jgi:hypothetical protein
MHELSRTEFEALRATIRERGTVRMWVVSLGLAAWGLLAVSLVIAELSGGVSLVPFLVLAATFEISFFIHTGVERIGRYIQVYFEDASGWSGWETTAMNYGQRFPGGADPLFIMVFAASAFVNFFSSITTAVLRPGWILLSLIAHGLFAWRLITADRLATRQRATDLERFRALKNT